MAVEMEYPQECVVDRRRANRRKPQGEPKAKLPPAERRAKPERRGKIDPTTCEREYSDSEIEFMRAMDDYKRRSGRPFPTWSEVLEVLRDLGYRQVANQSTTYTPTEVV